MRKILIRIIAIFTLCFLTSLPTYAWDGYGWWDDCDDCSFWLDEVDVYPDYDWGFDDDWGNNDDWETDNDWDDYDEWDYDYDSGSNNNDNGWTDSNSNDDPPTEDSDQVKVEKVIEKVKVELVKMGVDITGIEFRYGSLCSSRGRCVNGIVELCSLSLRLEFKDQIAVVWHEIFHSKDDAPWSREIVRLPEPIMLNPPEHIKAFLQDYVAREIAGLNLNPYFADQSYSVRLTLENIHDPVYYQNEINAYTAEINSMTDVSDEYRQEREFLLWKHEQSLIISQQYYKK